MPPSSTEEIAAQHAEALRLIESNMPLGPRKELGPISLKDKLQPTFLSEDQEEKKEKEDHNLENPICFTTRGSMDVQRLQQMIGEGYNLKYTPKDLESTPLSSNNYWDPRNAAKNNVAIMRPSHDAWGIQKIVLVFCDDFTTSVYELPWFKTFQPELQPIIDQVLPPGASLVRLLFASLPPGVTIPIHHDTGEWVKTSHRVHVPIIVNDPSRVLFRCGPTPTTMQRIDCEPGHIFEINNQAKHAVSNCDNDSRVHLIMDYIEETGPDRIVLDAGEKLMQTRRSVDRVKDIQVRPSPSYIILGAQKAGTTSLYDYIIKHPWVAQARRRETHCLDWRWNDQLESAEEQLEHCRKFFYTEQLKHHPSCLTGDSTPSYLLDSRRVIPRIQQIFDWKLKFFVMLRDPVKRALSHYAMVTSSEGTPAQLKTRGGEWRKKNFRQVVESELSILEKCGLIPYWDIKEGKVDQEKFDSFFGSKEEDAAWDMYLKDHVPLNTGSYGLLTRGMYALQLRPWLRTFDNDQFLILKLESMKRVGMEEFLKPVWAHLELPFHTIEDDAAKNTRSYQSMQGELQQYLGRFFEPHNRRLAETIGLAESEEWCNPWPQEQ